MKSETNDIYEMLDTLALPAAAQRFAQLSESRNSAVILLCSSCVRSWNLST